jgi:hypothetical protein
MSVLLSVTVLQFIFKLLFFLLAVAAIVCPNKCYLLTYLLTCILVQYATLVKNWVFNLKLRAFYYIWFFSAIMKVEKVYNFSHLRPQAVSLHRKCAFDSINARIKLLPAFVRHVEKDTSQLFQVS